MTFSALLTQTATIRHKAATATPGDYNAPTFTETTTTEPVYLEQLSRTEDAAGRDTVVGTHRAFFEATVTLAAIDTVVIAGITYEVVGPPDVVFNPRLGTAHHIEATLVEAS